MEKKMTAGLKKQIYFTGIAAFILLGIALSNSALIRYIDSAYSTIISSDLEVRKAMNRCSVECASIQSYAINMLIVCDSLEITKLRHQVYQSFSRIDKEVNKIARRSDIGINRTTIVKLQNACLSYRQTCASFAIIISSGNILKASDFARTSLQMEYVSFSGTLEHLQQEITSSAEQQSKSLTFKNSMMSKMITSVGIIPIIFWCSGALIIISIAIRHRLFFFSKLK